MVVKSEKQLAHEYVFKCLWDATAVKLVIQGKDYDDALRRCERQLIRTEGGNYCREIQFVRQTR